MKKILLNLKLTTRISIVIILFLVVLFSAFCAVFYVIQKKQIVATVDERMRQGVKNLNSAVDAYCEQVKLQNAIDSLIKRIPRGSASG
ncbi:MAG: hypothetical protein WCK02_09610 [Bacteroidota bacterium]